jgi:hypothetical protein
MATQIDITGVSEDALNLKNMLEGIVERVENVYQSYNVPLPSRRYWTLSEPAIDCEQVVVYLSQLYLGPPGAQASEPQRCNVARSATVNISISREIAVVGQNGRPPSAEKIAQTATSSAIDAWVLMESIKLFDMWDETGYGVGVIATLEVSPAEGGFQTVVLQITMAVP